MNKIVLGIIGIGQMGGTYLQLLREFNDVDVVAVCDTSDERLKFAREIGVKNLYVDYREMIDKESLDGVIIATPPKYHVEQALYAYKSGAYILLEKPIASNIEEARRLYTVVGDTERIMVAFSLRYHGFYQMVKKLFMEELGEPLYIWHIALGKLPSVPWLRDKSMSGGMLNENGVHVVYLHYWYAGKPIKVYASAKTLTQGLSIEDNLYLQLIHERATSVFIQSWSYGHRWRNWGAVAENGRIVVDGYLGGKYTISKPHEIVESEEIKQDVMEMYREQLRHFINCIRDKAKPLTPLREGIIIQEIVNAAYESARKNEPLTLSITLS